MRILAQGYYSFPMVHLWDSEGSHCWLKVTWGPAWPASNYHELF